MEQGQRFYPIGIQAVSEIGEKDYLYIDKTEYVYYITHFDSEYVFLSYPRLFGNSALHAYLRIGENCSKGWL